MTIDPAVAHAVPLPPSKPDYRPLKSLKLPGVEINPEGLILVVGPNSSGKTQLLRDIHGLLSGDQRTAVVCEQIIVDKPANLDGFLADLEERQYVKRFRDANGNEYIQSTAPLLGYGPAKSGQTHFPQVQSAFNSLQAGPFTTHNNQSAPFFNALGHCLVTALFLDRRLNMVNESPNFDYEKMPPTNEIQALFVNKGAKAELADEVKQVFGKGIWMDSSRPNILCLRINQKPEIPPAEERLEPEDMKKYRTIESEGDGLRSYVGITVSLLLGLRPICLIDEPELCLHPPQAYRMGLFIGRHGTTQKHAIFASTHSSHVLRGVIEATANVQVLRLTKYAERFKAHLIGPDELRECMDRPIIRAETILDGIFADGVALVEADGDRAVYQASWESVTKGRPHRDVLFIPVGGTGGFAEIAAFYRRLKIPVAVIADLDLLTDPDKLGKILITSCGRERRDSILDKCREIAKQIKEIPPCITPDQVRERLRAIADGPIDWTPKTDEQDDDVKLRKSLNGLAKEVDRLRHLKAGGVEGLKETALPLYEALTQIIEDCKPLGVFLVPVGEVEQWEPAGIDDAPSHRKKAEWANWAAADVRRRPDAWSELHQFTRSLEAFEQAEALRIANE
ncbi:MAG TPA: AAA family ATPase [Tepidisphaeraceae bacterium]|jgi:energy-coupling factor transporter ATP-binding protein EcfA2